MTRDRSAADAPGGDSEADVEVDGSDPADSGLTDPGSADSDLTDSDPNAPDRSAIEDRLLRLLRNGRTNAIVAWAMVAVLVGVFVESFLDADLLSMVFVAGLVAVVLAPAVSARNWKVLLPAELLGVALLPTLVRALLGGEPGVFATYFALAALALVIIVELHMFTSLRVTHWFAITLVVLTTLAAAAAWTVLRWNADRLLGTTYLTTNEALMIDWIYVTLAGLAAGILFDAYFRRRGRRLGRALRRVVRR